MLSERREQFCREYLIDLNGAQAAVRAGYAPESARIEGVRLLSDANIQDRIAELMAARATRVQLSQDSVLEKYTWIAFRHARDVATWGPDGLTLRPSGDLTEAESYAVCEVTQTQFGMKIKMEPKEPALRMLAVHLGLDTDRKNVRVQNEYIGMTEEVLQRKVSQMLVAMPKDVAISVIAEVVKRIGKEEILNIFNEKET